MQEPGKRSFHFCIVNLVIGTLYCVKGNYEFGIARIIKSLEPESEKLESDTWFYAKRCLLALFEGIAKHMLVVKVSATHGCVCLLPMLLVIACTHRLHNTGVHKCHNVPCVAGGTATWFVDWAQHALCLMSLHAVCLSELAAVICCSLLRRATMFRLFDNAGLFF